MLTTEQLDRVIRCALAFIADSVERRAEALLFAHGFTPELLAGLVRDGAAIAQTERVGRWALAVG
jgi:hypothetical protein